MNLLVTGAFNLEPGTRKKLEECGYEIYFHKDEKATVEHPEKYHAVICNALFLYNPMESFKSLRIVQLTSAGYDRIPLDYIIKNNIRLYNAKGTYSIPMAEFAICGILELYKQSKFFFHNQEEHIWEKHRGLLELHGKHVSIVGVGDVGIAIAERLKAFGCYVVGINRTLRENPFFDEMVPLINLEEEVSKSDIVILSIGMTDETKAIIRPCIPNCMRENSILVNVARGGLVDLESLASSINSNKLFGAVLDVFEDEPLDVNNSLWNSDNVIITPHNSFVGEGNSMRLQRLVRRNMLEAFYDECRENGGLS